MTIGYYVHHHGRGHASRATAIAARLSETVTGLSSLPRPRDWPGDWVQLARDDLGPTALAPAALDPTAGGRLHWVPLGDAGLSERMAAMVSWMHRERPSAMVVDISVEVVVLCRLLGVPVITFALPGLRDDEPHRLGYDLAGTVLAAWPDGIPSLARGLTPSTLAKLIPVGAISRFAPAPVTDAGGSSADAGSSSPDAGASSPDAGASSPDAEASSPEAGSSSTDARRVLVLQGAGGGGHDAAALEHARSSSPGWSWEVLGGPTGRWSDDPWQSIRTADVVITHAGQNALAEVAAARRPAIVIPQPRPHDEQLTTAAALAEAGYPVIVLDRLAHDDWPALLERAVALPTARWSRWNDGHGADRAARAIERATGPRAATPDLITPRGAPSTSQPEAR